MLNLPDEIGGILFLLFIFFNCYLGILMGGWVYRHPKNFFKNIFLYFFGGFLFPLIGYFLQKTNSWPFNFKK